MKIASDVVEQNGEVQQTINKAMRWVLQSFTVMRINFDRYSAVCNNTLLINLARLWGNLERFDQCLSQILRAAKYDLCDGGDWSPKQIEYYEKIRAQLW